MDICVFVINNEIVLGLYAFEKIEDEYKKWNHENISDN